MGQELGLGASIMLSLMAFGVGALLWGSWLIGVRHGNRQKGVLMLIAAIVLAGNVAIWSV